MASLTKVCYDDAMYFCMLINTATFSYINASTFINMPTRIRIVVTTKMVAIYCANKGSFQRQYTDHCGV